MTTDWPKYKSHKIVRALPIVSIAEATEHKPRELYVALTDGAQARFIPHEQVMADKATFGDYAVVYDDDYKSVSPKAAFEGGYAALPAEHEGLPVAGYKPQTDMRVKWVNENKHFEEQILRMLDAYDDTDDIDLRWLSIARTHIEQGFMAFNRAIFRPSRISLPEDKAAEG